MPQATRFWVIAQTGIGLAWKSRWLRRLLVCAWLPAAYMGLGFFFLEQMLDRPEGLARGLGFLGQFPQAASVLEQATVAGPAATRHEAWSWLLLTFFRYPQGILIALVVGLVAPPLVAGDVHSRAFLLYFSRPLTRVEYIAGKLAVVCTYVFLITTLPALGLYVLGVLLSPPAVSVLSSTWDLPLRILASSAVLMIPTSAMALAFSALTTRTFFAGFAWFAAWLMGMVGYLILWNTPELAISEQWSLISLFHTLGKVQSWIFGLPVSSAGHTGFVSVLPSAVLLAGIAVVSLLVVFRRVSSTMRA